MKQDEMCSYYNKWSTKKWHDVALGRVWGYKPTKEGDLEAKRGARKYVRCPKCGRRLKRRVYFCHDGCCALFAIPPQKKKRWWKKKKRTKTEKRLKK